MIPIEIGMISQDITMDMVTKDITMDMVTMIIQFIIDKGWYILTKIFNNS